jgi:PII-like signaling protein
MSQFHTMSALRIYLKHGDNRKASRWWQRAFEKPLSTHLVHAALRADIQHAAVTLGHIGFAKDATRVVHDNAEIPMATLPVCVELLAPKRRLEQFIREQAKHLAATTMVMVDGIHISHLHLAEVDEAVEHRPHSVEYITAGDVPLQVDHVGPQALEEESAEGAGG